MRYTSTVRACSCDPCVSFMLLPAHTGLFKLKELLICTDDDIIFKLLHIRHLVQKNTFSGASEK